MKKFERKVIKVMGREHIVRQVMREESIHREPKYAGINGCVLCGILEIGESFKDWKFRRCYY